MLGDPSRRGISMRSVEMSESGMLEDHFLYLFIAELPRYVSGDLFQSETGVVLSQSQFQRGNLAVRDLARIIRIFAVGDPRELT